MHVSMHTCMLLKLTDTTNETETDLFDTGKCCVYVHVHVHVVYIHDVHLVSVSWSSERLT